MRVCVPVCVCVCVRERADLRCRQRSRRRCRRSCPTCDASSARTAGSDADFKAHGLADFKAHGLGFQGSWTFVSLNKRLTFVSLNSRLTLVSLNSRLTFVSLNSRLRLPPDSRYECNIIAQGKGSKVMQGKGSKVISELTLEKNQLWGRSRRRCRRSCGTCDASSARTAGSEEGSYLRLIDLCITQL